MFYSKLLLIHHHRLLLQGLLLQGLLLEGLLLHHSLLHHNWLCLVKTDLLLLHWYHLGLLLEHWLFLRHHLVLLLLDQTLLWILTAYLLIIHLSLKILHYWSLLHASLLNNYNGLLW